MSSDRKIATKIICIGWHKTGTTTLGDALLILGYSVMGARIDLAERLLANDKEGVLSEVTPFDALQDVPWNALFKELDAKYPHSKFILTIRDEQKWLRSATKHFKDAYSPMREWLYGHGVILGNEQVFLNRYRQHNQEVLDYFKDRPNDLLILNLDEGFGWNEICLFLNEPISKKKFPHSNKGQHNYSLKDLLIEKVKALTPLWLRKLRLKTLQIFGVTDSRYRFNNRIQNESIRKKMENR